MNAMTIYRIARPAFAGKGIRVIRALLVQREKSWEVVKLAQAVNISTGYSAKIFRLLRDSGAVLQRTDGNILQEPRSLLDAWAETRRLGDCELVQRFKVDGDADAVEKRFIAAAKKLNASYALTLTSGAARRAPFARPSIVEAYLEGDPTPVIGELGAQPASEEDCNLLLARPHDEGVFFGAQEIDGVRIVSDVQLYVDLYNYSPRAREHADFLLDECMSDLALSDSPAVVSKFNEALKIRDQADVEAMKAKPDYQAAMKLYQELVARLSTLKIGAAISELRRARLILWMMLSHHAELNLDKSAIEGALSICVTDRDVEKLRREVGYNMADVELAILAYYAAQARMASEKTERERYAAKAKAHGSIALTTFSGGPDPKLTRAKSILERLES
jgi:hypothetical protein